MATVDFSKFTLYRWRYVVGYTIIVLLFCALLVFAGLYIPGGISESEKQSVIQSASLSIHHLPTTITNLPYYILQRVSINLFGVNDFSIKLPSLLLSLVAAIGLVFLLKRWFRSSMAILGSLIAITTGEFLFVAQSGTPGILYVVWSVWLLLLGTLVAKRAHPRLLYKMAFFIVAALSLYTPLTIYAMIALVTAIFLHPHLRFIIRQLSKARLAIGFIISLVIVTPLVLTIITTPSTILTLLGIPTSWPHLGANAMLLFHQYFDFMSISSSTLITPVFGLGSVLLIVIGLYSIFRTRETTQSYLILIWLACLVPVLLINPKFTSITFLPLVLLMTTGLQALIYYWYRLFPFNPYARIAGLFPLVLLVIALVFSGLDRYVYGYYFSPDTRANFSNDLRLLPKDTGQLVVAQSELPFYSIVGKFDNINIALLTPSGDPQMFIATRQAHAYFPTYKIGQIIANSQATNGDRLYVYKKTNL